MKLRTVAKSATRWRFGSLKAGSTARPHRTATRISRCSCMIPITKYLRTCRPARNPEAGRFFQFRFAAATYDRGMTKIPGVGPSIARDLHSLGIREVADLRGRDPELLYSRL